MRLRGARRDAEVRQHRLADQVGRTAGGSAHADVHARLAEVQRQQLGVTVGEMEKADVAEPRQIVHPCIPLAGQRGAAIERQAPGGGDREEVEEFAARHATTGACLFLVDRAGRSSRNATRSAICSGLSQLL